MSYQHNDAGRALVLSYYNLNHPSSGGTRRVAALLQALGARALVCQPGDAHPLLRSYVYPTDLAAYRGRINWGILNFYLPGNRSVAEQALRQESVAVAVLTSIWCMRPVEKFPRLPVVLDAQNVDGLNVAQRCGKGHPFTLFVRRRERAVMRRVDHIFACSVHDAERIRSDYGVAPSKITLVPNGTNVADNASACGSVPAEWKDACRGKRVLLFMGKLDYYPNVEALEFICRRLLPALDDRDPQFVLGVCGGPVPDRPRHPRLVYLGRVPAVEPYLQHADICIAPIFAGGGTRLKVLEYMAAGRPIVATPKAVEGLELRDGIDFIQADADVFADAIRQLASDDARARAVGIAARRRVQERYDWRYIRQAWLEVLSRWVPAVKDIH